MDLLYSLVLLCIATLPNPISKEPLIGCVNQAAACSGSHGQKNCTQRISVYYKDRKKK